MKPITVPSAGESIKEVTILEWLKPSGEFVEANEAILSLETDKASMEIFSEHSGVLHQKAQPGETVAVGSVVAEIDETQQKPKTKPLKASSKKPQAAEKQSPATENVSPPLLSPTLKTTPASRKMMKEKNLSPQEVTASGPRGHILKQDVQDVMPTPSLPLSQPIKVFSENITRKPLSRLRKTLSHRLVESQNKTASLTTFNEIDMSSVIELRKKYKETFEKKYGFKLGFMGFFVKAAVEALKTFPEVNGFIENDEIIYHHYQHVGVAVSTDKGLVVPVVRHADQLSLAQVEQNIQFFAQKARTGQISLEDLSGGTFTVSNGGVFGSLMSTPILNPPQSGILGMHKVEARPVVVDSQIEIRPMMYVALTYDHRIIDGRESVGFLKKIKECIEDPCRILIEV